MLPHQQRVVDEKSELDEKISKLDPFLNTQIFKELHESEKVRLRLQLHYMIAYSKILGERILCF